MNAITQRLKRGYELTQDQVSDFRANGHVLLPAVVSQEDIDYYRPAINDAVKRLNEEKRKMAERDTYGKAFLQTMNLWRQDKTVRAFSLAGRFGQIAANLLGVAKVRIYHDQALFKEPGGGPTPWHQDQFYWPLDSHDTVTMWMPLVPVSEAMGMLTFASGSHKKGLLFNTEISDESEEIFEEYVRKENFPVHRASHMNAGDATWHYGCTIHNAPGNSSARMREVMTVIYVADHARITAPKNQFQENDRRQWLGNMPVGSLVDSELNPLCC
jgi:ectoine hydroxylase-related dioxygenase (phytanoyl-CoA dioxygenase family)